MKFRFVFVLAAAIVLGCAPAEDLQVGETQIDREADRAAIEEILRVASVANQTGDVEAWVGNLTDDAIFMNPDAPPIDGKAALREWVEQRFAASSVQVTISPLEIVVDHDLAFNRTHVTGFEVLLETGDTVAVDWKEIAILERQPDGRWLVSRVIGNSNVPMR
jgi:ketosteroid isomerase-like protein